MKRMKYPIHPDFKKWENVNPPLNKVAVPIMQKLLGLIFFTGKTCKEAIIERLQIPSSDGKKIKALMYTPKGAIVKTSCLIYYHGGGFVLPAAPHHYKLAKEYAVKTPCKVLFVNYRLAPKFAFPVAPEDCYMAYKWVSGNARDLGVDPSSIAVGGDSAGGGSWPRWCV